MCAHSSSAVDQSYTEDSKPVFGKRYDRVNDDPVLNTNALEKYFSKMCGKEIKNCSCFRNTCAKKDKNYSCLNKQGAWDISIICIDTLIKSAENSLDVMKKSLDILNMFKDIRPSVHNRKLKEDALSKQSLTLSLKTGETDEHVILFCQFIRDIDHLTGTDRLKTYYKVEGLVFEDVLIQLTKDMEKFFNAFHDCDQSQDEKIPLLQGALKSMSTKLDQVKIFAQNWINGNWIEGLQKRQIREKQPQDGEDHDFIQSL